MSRVALQVQHYTIVARCDGVHGVLYTRGGKWNPRRSRVCHFPSRVYKTHGPQSQRATIVLLYLCIIVIPLLEVLLLPSNIITTDYSLFNKQTNKKQFPRTRGCFVHSAKSTNAGNDQGDVHRCTSLFMLPGPSSHVTCVFVARHMIGSRPMKLHSLLPRYNKRICCRARDWLSTNQTSQFVTKV